MTAGWKKVEAKTLLQTTAALIHLNGLLYLHMSKDAISKTH